MKITAVSGGMRKVLAHPVTRNALALYAIQLANYVLPLVTVPYLARVLRPEGWGLVAFAQSFALWLSLVIEYGFSFSASREIARNRGDWDHIAGVVAGVAGANSLLLFGATLLAALISGVVPVFRRHQLYLWLAFLSAAVQGLSPFWYFQGMERMQLPGAINVIARVMHAFGIFLWVKAPDDGWKVLALQAVTGFIALGITVILLYREVPVRLPHLGGAVSALRMGWSMFIFRSAVSLYTTANVFILGLFVPPALVGYYGGAEKISKAVLGLVGPLSQAIYPRMSHLAMNERKKAVHLGRLGFLIIGGAGVLLGWIVAVFAPLWVDLLLGQGYDGAVPVLRLIALLIPLVAMSNVMGIQWMLPLGMDRDFNAVILSAGIINLVLAVFLAPRFGPSGMAWAVVSAEFFVTFAMAWILHRSGQGFWQPIKEDLS